MYRSGYRENNNRHVIKLCKKVKKLFRLKFFEKLSEKQKTIIEDIGEMTTGMIEFLLVDEFKTIDEYIDSINSFLEFEQKTFFYNLSLTYKIGNMKQLSELIRVQHQIIELKKVLNN
jgi:hypothetical protein